MGCEIYKVGCVGTSIGAVIAISFLIGPGTATTYIYGEKLHEELIKEPQNEVNVGLFATAVAIASNHLLLSILLICCHKNCCMLYVWSMLTLLQMIALVVYAICYFRTTAEIVGTCVAEFLAFICCAVVFSQGTKVMRGHGGEYQYF